jgi:hypothetical protein
VAGLKYGGRLPGGLSVDVEAEVDLPETVLVQPADGPLPVGDVIWDAPVAIRRTQEGIAADLMWAVEDGYWREAEPDGSLLLADVEPGRHVFRFAAREEGFWLDATPLELAVDYRPDYEKFVARWVPKLLDDDPDVRTQARKKLMMAGPGVRPALATQLEEAREARRLVGELEAVLRETRQKE